MAKTSLMSGLVQDHGVVHVVSSVGDDSDNGVHAIREVVETVFIVQWCANDRCLAGLQSIRLVVCPVSEGGSGRTHRLL